LVGTADFVGAVVDAVTLGDAEPVSDGDLAVPEPAADPLDPVDPVPTDPAALGCGACVQPASRPTTKRTVTTMLARRNQMTGRINLRATTESHGTWPTCAKAARIGQPAASANLAGKLQRRGLARFG
jgi:hypothetical protein